jgi:hypothetical protein
MVLSLMRSVRCASVLAAESGVNAFHGIRGFSEGLVRRCSSALGTDGVSRTDPIASRETPAHDAQTGFRHPQALRP